MTRFRTLAAILLAITLLAAACGEDDADTTAVGDDSTTALPPGSNSNRSKRAFAMREVLGRDLQACGYTFVALDVFGYRSGAMNQMLQEDNR